MARTAVVVLAGVFGACGDDGAVNMAESTTGTSVASSGEAASSSSSSGEADTSGTGYEPPTQVCGNGFVEGAEQCDDANDVDDDDCTNACQVPCGLQWLTLAPPPTPQSDLEPAAVASAEDERVYVVARVREVTSDQEGNETIHDNEVFVHALDADGAEVWTKTLGSEHGSAVPVATAVGADAVYVAATLAAADGGNDIVVAALRVSDGTELWRHEASGEVEGGVDEATGIAIAPDGSPVVAGQIRVGEGDDDVWIGKLDAATGDALWTSTWSGVGTDMFSTDNGGPVTVGDDGVVYIFAQDYIDFDAVTGTILRIPADGGEPSVLYVPETGTTVPLAIAVAPDDTLVLAYQRPQGVATLSFLEKIDLATQATVWQLQDEDFSDEGDVLRGVAVGPTGDVIAAGSYRVDGEEPFFGTWYERLDPSGERLCHFRHTEPVVGSVAPDLVPLAVTSIADTSLVIAGQRATEDEVSAWVGRFRGQ